MNNTNAMMSGSGTATAGGAAPYNRGQSPVATAGQQQQQQHIARQHGTTRSHQHHQHVPLTTLLNPCAVAPPRPLKYHDQRRRCVAMLIVAVGGVLVLCIAVSLLFLSASAGRRSDGEEAGNRRSASRKADGITSPNPYWHPSLLSKGSAVEGRGDGEGNGGDEASDRDALLAAARGLAQQLPLSFTTRRLVASSSSSSAAASSSSSAYQPKPTLNPHLVEHEVGDVGRPYTPDSSSASAHSSASVWPILPMCPSWLLSSTRHQKRRAAADGRGGRVFSASSTSAASPPLVGDGDADVGEANSNNNSPPVLSDDQLAESFGDPLIGQLRAIASGGDDGSPLPTLQLPAAPLVKPPRTSVACQPPNTASRVALKVLKTLMTNRACSEVFNPVRVFSAPLHEELALQVGSAEHGGELSVLSMGSGGGAQRYFRRGKTNRDGDSDSGSEGGVTNGDAAEEEAEECPFASPAVTTAHLVSTYLQGSGRINTMVLLPGGKGRGTRSDQQDPEAHDSDGAAVSPPPLRKKKSKKADLDISEMNVAQLIRKSRADAATSALLEANSALLRPSDAYGERIYCVADLIKKRKGVVKGKGAGDGDGGGAADKRSDSAISFATSVAAYCTVDGDGDSDGSGSGPPNSRAAFVNPSPQRLLGWVPSETYDFVMAHDLLRSFPPSALAAAASSSSSDGDVLCSMVEEMLRVTKVGGGVWAGHIEDPAQVKALTECRIPYAIVAGEQQPPSYRITLTVVKEAAFLPFVGLYYAEDLERMKGPNAAKPMSFFWRKIPRTAEDDEAAQGPTRRKIAVGGLLQGL